MNDITDDNIGFDNSFNTSNSEISSLKGNESRNENSGTYRNVNGYCARSSILQSTLNRNFGGSGAVLSTFTDGINNKISHIERVKEKRKQVLAMHNTNGLCSSLHNKKDINNDKQHEKSIKITDSGDEDNERLNDDIINDIRNYYTILWNNMYDIIDKTKKINIETWLNRYCGNKRWVQAVNSCHNLTKRIFDKYSTEGNGNLTGIIISEQLLQLFDPATIWRPRIQLSTNEKLIKDQEK